MTTNPTTIHIAKGVNVRFSPSKAASGKKPWVVYIEAIIGGEEKRQAPCFATMEEAVAEGRIFALALDVLRKEWAEAEAKKRANVTVVQGSFQAYAEDWLALKMKLKPATRASYEQLLNNHVYPIIGTVPMHKDTFDVHVIDRLVKHHDQIQTGTGTMKAIVRVVSSCCTFARLRGVLIANPCDRRCAEIARPDDEPVEPNPMTEDQMESVLTWTYKHERWWYPEFLLLFRAGPRIGEASALRTDLVDLDAKVAYLKWSYSHRAGKDQQTKRWRGRPIELSEHLCEELERQIAETKKLLFKYGKDTKTIEHVFYTPRAVRALPDTERTVWDKAMKGCKLTRHGFTPHDARDTFATTHLSISSERLMWVSMMLGHRHISTTLDRYSRWVRTVASQGYADSLDRRRPLAEQEGDDR